MYFVLSTQDTAEFSLDKEILPEKFLMFITREDFPLRVVSKMVMVRALIDFLFISREQLTGPGVMGGNLVDISEKFWESAFDAWKKLRSVELSDRYINLWLQFELKEGD